MAILEVPINYLSIQSAIDSGVEGDLILVNEGIYKESVVVNKSNIVIMANGNNVILDGNSGTLDTAFLIENTLNSEINGFRIRNYRTDSIIISGGRGNRVISNEIINSGGNGISGDASNSLIWKNKIINSSGDGLFIQRSIGSGGSTLINNYLDKSRANGINVMEVLSGIIVDNVIVNNGLAGTILSNGTENTLFYRNRSINNRGSGIEQLNNSDSADILSNKSIDNAHGIVIDSIQNIISCNQVEGNLGEGINIRSQGIGFNYIRKNLVRLNYNNGISINSNNNSMMKNIVEENKAIDVYYNDTENDFFENKYKITDKGNNDSK